MAGLLGVWWGKGGLGSKLYPESLSPGESHFSGTPGRLCVLGLPTAVGRVSLGGSEARMEKEG